jgi:hypothetical protein
MKALAAHKDTYEWTALSDRHGSRGLATAGLLVSAVGLFGLSRIGATTSYGLIALFMILMGGMSGAPHALESFIAGLHEVFIISVAITLVAALVSALQPAHTPTLPAPPQSS